MKQKLSNLFRPLSTSLIILILFLISGLLFFRVSLYGAWFLLLLGVVGVLIALLALALLRSHVSVVLAFLTIVLLSGMAAASIHDFLVENPGILYSLPASPFFRSFWALSTTEYEFAMIISVVMGIGVALALFGLVALAQVFWLALVDTRRSQRESPAWTAWFQELMGWVVFLILVFGVYLIGMAFFLTMESRLSLARVDSNYAFFPIFLIPLLVVALATAVRFLSIWRGAQEPSSKVVFEEDITDKATKPILASRLHLEYDYLPADALGYLLASVREEVDAVMREAAERITASLVRDNELDEVRQSSLREDFYRRMTVEVRSASTDASITIIFVIGISIATAVVAKALFAHSDVIKQSLVPLKPRLNSMISEACENPRTRELISSPEAPNSASGTIVSLTLTTMGQDGQEKLSATVDPTQETLAVSLNRASDRNSDRRQ